MKEQRWPGDYETVSQEFAYSKREEQKGLDAQNLSHGNDYMAYGLALQQDAYQTGELQQSWSEQLDVVGRQPHAREYVEYEMNYRRSERKYLMCDGQVIDYPDGVQFSGMP